MFLSVGNTFIGSKSSHSKVREIASLSPVQSSAFGPMVKPLPKIQNAI
jgi:hypothetical protein